MTILKPNGFADCLSCLEQWTPDVSVGVCTTSKLFLHVANLYLRCCISSIFKNIFVAVDGQDLNKLTQVSLQPVNIIETTKSTVVND